MDQLLLEIDEKIARCSRIHDPKLEVDNKTKASFQNIVEYVQQIRLLRSVIHISLRQTVVATLKKTSVDLDQTIANVDRLYRRSK